MTKKVDLRPLLWRPELAREWPGIDVTKRFIFVTDDGPKWARVSGSSIIFQVSPGDHP